MSDKEAKQAINSGEDEGRKFLKTVIIVVAIIEALAMIPVIIHLIRR